MTRRQNKIFLSLAFLLFSPATALAQDSLWKIYTDAGMKAYQEGRYAEAERRLQLARKEADGFGPHDTRVALNHYDLALIYLKEDKPAEAIKHSKLALAVWEGVVWEKQPRSEALAAGYSSEALAGSLLGAGVYDVIEQLLNQSVAIKRKFLRPENPAIATTLTYLAITNLLQKKYDESDAHYKQALEIYEALLHKRSRRRYVC